MLALETLKRALALTPSGRLLYSRNKLAKFKEHVVAAVDSQAVGTFPYYHLYIQDVFPEELYAAIETRMKYYRESGKLKQRSQDSAAFVNSRFNLRKVNDAETRYIRDIFSDNDVKRALFSKFYARLDRNLVEDARIHHEEFEYVYTGAGRFQNIHTDIPPKVLSLVFYIPNGPVSPSDEDRNGTVFYDRELKPQSKAKYRRNSVGIFAPHFHSYHGFATTIDRPALVMFYVHPQIEAEWIKVRSNETPPFDAIKDLTAAKLRRFPLVEVGDREEDISRMREGCRINAPSGRVIIDK
jgi:hypothetical protein